MGDISLFVTLHYLKFKLFLFLLGKIIAIFKQSVCVSVHYFFVCPGGKTIGWKQTFLFYGGHHYYTDGGPMFYLEVERAVGMMLLRMKRLQAKQA